MMGERLHLQALQYELSLGSAIPHKVCVTNTFSRDAKAERQTFIFGLRIPLDMNWPNVIVVWSERAEDFRHFLHVR